MNNAIQRSSAGGADLKKAPGRGRGQMANGREWVEPGPGDRLAPSQMTLDERGAWPSGGVRGLELAGRPVQSPHARESAVGISGGHRETQRLVAWRLRYLEPEPKTDTSALI